VIVPKERAEEIRQKLVDDGVMLEHTKVRREGDLVYFPVKRQVHIEGCAMGSGEFEIIRRKSYDDALRERGIHIDSISLDLIGDIAVIRLQEESCAKEVAQAIMETNPHVRTVCLDRGVEDDFRVRKVEVVAGERNTETIHREHGIRMKVDVARVYFSPRLSSERMRVAKKIEHNATVIDMFAGVAPFCLYIAKFSHPKKIYAIDKNPHAVRYARENVLMNKKEDIIEVIEGDARDVMGRLPQADHIIMNLPHQSHEYLSHALQKGKHIHYYEIMEKERIEERVRQIVKESAQGGYSVNAGEVRVIGSYSPSKVKVAMDLEVKHF